MQTISNGQARELISWEDLTAKEQKDHDYVEGEDRYSFRFFRYRGNVYDIGEMQPVPESLAATLPKSWAGSDDDPRYNYYLAEGFGFGIVISLGDDGDFVVPGRYFG